MVETSVLSKKELLRVLKLFFADQNRGISIELFAELAGLSKQMIIDVFIKQELPLTEYVQRRASKAYKEWRDGKVAVMQNRDNTRFLQYRKEPKPRIARGYGLQVIGNEIKLKIGIVNKAEYRDTLAEQLGDK